MRARAQKGGCMQSPGTHKQFGMAGIQSTRRGEKSGLIEQQRWDSKGPRDNGEGRMGPQRHWKMWV